MNLTPWLASGIGIGIVMGGQAGTIAHDSPRPFRSIAPDAVTILVAEAALNVYTLPGNFSLSIPSDWITRELTTERQVVVTNYDPTRAPNTAVDPSDIKTEALMVDDLPEQYVGQELARLIEHNYPVQRYTTVNVNGHTGLRLWVNHLPLDYTRQMITFVGYPTGTVKVVTHYNLATPETEALIEQVHNSLELAL